MTERDLADFSGRLGLPSIELSKDKPFAFTLDGRVHFTMQYSALGRLCLVLSAPLPEYDDAALKKAFCSCSYLHKGRKLDFAVGFAKDKLYLMHELPADATGSDAVNAVLALLAQYDE